VFAVKIVIVAILLCFSNLNAQTAFLKVKDVQRNSLSSTLSGQITISCTTNYSPAKCLTNADELARVLRRYPTIRLGEWNFVLADSEHWEQLLRSLKRDPGSPAFTEFVARVTVLEDTLFETADSRRKWLAERYGQLPGDLLDYAATHEMGHAICRERNESLAEEYGFDLRMGVEPVCGIGR
jgi:hypothetical protein